jgi:hypothetical protein
MGFFSDFIGAFTGKTERDAAKDAVAGINKGIQYTQDQIAQSKAETLPLYNLAFKNLNEAFQSNIQLPQQALSGQLGLLGAGTARLSPEGPGNSLQNAVRMGNSALTGVTPFARQEQFTPVSRQPFNVRMPQFENPLGGVNA